MQSQVGVPALLVIAFQQLLVVLVPALPIAFQLLLVVVVLVL
jgi:hypothetical protein